MSSATITRSHTRTDGRGGPSAADELLRASLTRGSSLASSTAPPSYRRHDETPAVKKARDSRVISAAEIDSRLRSVQYECDRAKAAAAPRSTKGLFKEACSTDVLFLMDTTSSMSSYIEAAKNQIRDIVKDTKEAFLNESHVRIAVVGYKDHGDYPNVEFLDFTSSVGTVHNFLDRLEASGGADIPEDVLGGIQQAINASWKQQNRIIVHIADAPAHGRPLHDLHESCDDYYVPGSEPHGLTYEPLIRQLVNLNINYAFLRIFSTTDCMAFAFGQAYGGGSEMRLLPGNTYSSDKVDSLLLTRSEKAKPGMSAAPQFEEVQLGTTYSALKNLVVSSITASVTRTANRLSLALSRGSASRSTGTGTVRGARGKLSRGPNLAAITEVHSVGVIGRKKSVRLEKGPPLWDMNGWLDKTLTVEGYCLDLALHGPDTLNSMMDSDENIKLGIAELTLHARAQPFAQGASRLAAFARPDATTSKFVLKSFINPKDGSLASSIEDMRMQALCKAFALEFNGLVKPVQPLDFITTLSLQDKHGDGNLSLEPFIEGSYVKYNSNGAWVLEDDSNPFNETAQAFSHFTFERSWGHLLVTDLQGVGNLLTDPAIQTKDPERFKLGMTNMREEGFKFFFAMHKCNETCRALGLLSNGSMLLTGNFTFRETWPTLDPTVFCSNKLCRKIIRVAIASKSSKFPDCYWCSDCFPQLDAFNVNIPCAAPGADNHMFKVSRFYHESQLEATPSICPEHAEKDTTVSGASVVGGNLWASMKSTHTPSAISGRVW
jgi:Mg-chelatase subunit ChlD